MRREKQKDIEATYAWFSAAAANVCAAEGVSITQQKRLSYDAQAIAKVLVGKLSR